MPKSIPISVVDPASGTYPNVDAAVAAAVKAFADGRDKDTGEKAAVVVKMPDGSFAYSSPVSQEQHDAFALRAQLTNGQSLAAIVHTHPGEDDLGQVFSPRDLDVARQLNVPSYVQFRKDGALRRYTPGKTQTTMMKTYGGAQRVATGDPVAPIAGLGQQPPALLGNAPQTSAVLGRAPVD